MSNEIDEKPRKYRKRRRAEREEETRRRITEAAVKLHGTIGPAKTTVSGIAREAGVQRATVYRHFPDEDAIYAACTSHYNALHPPPDLEAWAAVGDPDERLRLGLNEIYAFYDETHGMLESTGRDAERVPAVGRAVAAMDAYREEAAAVLMRGRAERGRARTRAAAAIGHALAFSTWGSIVRDEGLGAEEAVELMTALVAAAGRRRG
ncbi:MAG: helix-turn-helix transcriptional regulator [Solirubrobacterales bacterium]|nr:helix-turn-helix transcriptional regulator [Solirubrobacterales bacterium]